MEVQEIYPLGTVQYVKFWFKTLWGSCVFLCHVVYKRDFVITHLQQRKFCSINKSAWEREKERPGYKWVRIYSCGFFFPWGMSTWGSETELSSLYLHWWDFVWHWGWQWKGRLQMVMFSWVMKQERRKLKMGNKDRSHQSWRSHLNLNTIVLYVIARNPKPSQNLKYKPPLLLRKQIITAFLLKGSWVFQSMKSHSVLVSLRHCKSL